MEELPKRKPNRLSGYDYHQNGAYFITICAKGKRRLFWNVGATFGRPQDTNHLSAYGKIIKNEIERIPQIYCDVVGIDCFVVMPNHIHMIVILKGGDGRPKVAPTISRVIQQFKGSITKQIGFSPWQKLFHDHIIRDERDYHRIWDYIDTNPLKWEDDCFYVS